MRPRYPVTVLAAAALAAGATAQTVPPNFTVTNLATSLSVPTAMAVASNGDVYICQQNGLLRVRTAAGTLATVTTFSVDSAGERGLLGVALDPAFATNRFVYVYYTATTPAVHNRISRITLDATGTAMVAGSEAVLLDLNNLGATNHNGGAIHFGPDGRLYAAVGENAVPANAQSITNLLGKILRLNPTPGAAIPTDNPTSFPGISGVTTGNNRAIWAVGLRNPFTFAFNPVTGRMFIDDVGNSTWEEINDGLAGRNYGWPTTEGFFTQSSFPDFTEPLVAYHHSNGSLNSPPGIGFFTGLVIVGGAFYSIPAGTNANFPVSFQGDYFFGDELANFIRTFDPAGSTGQAFGSGFTNIVGLAVASDATLLFLRGAGSSSGVLGRITYTAPNGACCAPDGTCTSVNGLNCPAQSTFSWGGTCSPNTCPLPTGACCTGSTCSVVTAGGCTGANTAFSGVGTVCNAAGNTTTPCCKADFNHAFGVSVQDIFDFIAAYFANDPAADFNASGGVSVQDIFDFVAAYFTGCP